MMDILDSGERRKFDSGAVRDIVDGKGRCDLLPLKSVAQVIRFNSKACADILECIDYFVTTGDEESILDAINKFNDNVYSDVYSSILEVAKHYEQGCNKYGERNWEKGIPLHCYIDSGVRHLLKYFRGDKDEPHDRAFIWNMLGAIWTLTNHPELVDLPFASNS